MAAQKKQRQTLWSFSRVSCFGHCKYEFYLNYIVNDPELYLPEGNYYAEVGSFVHEILAMVFDGRLKESDAFDYFFDHYDDYVCYKTSPVIMNSTFEKCAGYFAGLDLAWTRGCDIAGVEQEVRFNLDRHKFIGYIDLLLKDKDGGYTVVDHKSSPYPFLQNGGVKKACLDRFESYKRQMYLYCHAVNQLYGEFPKEIIWNHFKDGGRLARIPFVRSEYDEAMDWFRQTLKDIGKEKEYEPTQEHFYCRNLCNFRSCCEYNLVSE